MPKDPYSILGVAYQASPHEISAAYRRLAREHHPDVSDGDDSIARMQDINWAYTVLSTPARRRKLDSRTVRAWEAAWSRGSRAPGPNRGYSSSGHSPSTGYQIFGGSVDRAIVGALVALVILAASVLFGLSVYGAPISLAIGTWIGSVPNPRLSSQHGLAIGAVIGLISAASFSVTIFGPDEGSLIGGMICCAPFTLLLGGSLGAMFGTLAGWIRRASAVISAAK